MLADKKIYLLILAAFLISMLSSFLFVKTYDKYEVSTDEIENHSMIKGDIPDIWIDGQTIKNDLRNGKNYFESGKEIFRSYLPPRTIALFSYFLNYDLFEDSKNKVFSSNNKKMYYLFIQSLFYFFSLTIFFKEIKKHFEIRICNFIIFFLAIEPTIFFYHSSFHTESLFFTMQILMLTLLINNNQLTIKYIGIGILLGVMFLQKLVAIYYVIPIIIYYSYKLRFRAFKPLIIIFSLYVLIIFLVGYGNYKRANIFYFMPPSSKSTLHLYFPSEIISRAENIKETKAAKIIEKDRQMWINQNDINLNLEKDRITYYNYLQKYSIDIILKYPFTSVKFITWRTLQTCILNPIYIFEFYKEENAKRPFYYLNENYKKINLPIRIFYSSILYLIIIYGFFCSRKKIKIEHHILLILSSFYMLALLGWANNSRYFVPILIYLSIYFGYGLNNIYKFLSLRKQND